MPGFRTSISGRRDPFLVRRGLVDIDKKMYKDLVRIWDKAIAAYAQEASRHIGVETGMSLYSIHALAQEVRTLSKINFFSRRLRGKQPYQYDLSGRKTTQLKNYNAGIKAGRGAYKILRGSIKRPVFHFKFEIKVFQWLVNEEGRSGQAAWNALAAGQAAFEAYIEKAEEEVLDSIQGLVLNAVTGEP